MTSSNPVASHTTTLLLACCDPELLARIEPAFAAGGARVRVARSAAAALAELTSFHLPDWAVIDAGLPGMELGQLLFSMRAGTGSRFPIALIADEVTGEWLRRLAEGAIDDLIPRRAETAYWQLRAEVLVRTSRMTAELETLRDAAARNAQLDRLTGVYNREAMLAMLFRETDRVQRMKSNLSLVLFDLDDFGHWNSRLGVDACDELLCQVVLRTARILRSYDLLGRSGKDEFLVALPGCSVANAEMLAKRLRCEVFSTPFRIHDDSVRISACFGLASSQGRSPVVVLREAEQALAVARESGPESIQAFGAASPPPGPVALLSPASGDELLAW